MLSIENFVAQLADIFLRRSWVDLPGFVGVTVGWVLTLIAVICLAGLAERILFALAAYNDAMAKGSADATMWGLLIGFFGLIPGIIYLCVRGSQQRKVCCQKCGFWHNAFDPVCPRCGEPNPTVAQPANPYEQHYAERAKKLLIAALVCLGVAIVVSIVGFAAFCAFVTSNAVGFADLP